MPPVVLIRPANPVVSSSPVVFSTIPTQTPRKVEEHVHTDSESDDDDDSIGSESESDLPSSMQGSPQTREELEALLKRKDFDDKLAVLEMHLEEKIEITKRVIKILRPSTPRQPPSPVLVIHCHRLPDHRLIADTPELHRWDPVKVQDHQQEYLYIVSVTKKITINVTFKLIRMERGGR